jgi:nitrite reductase/ring-hydroxylating ferredoxin subunit
MTGPRLLPSPSPVGWYVVALSSEVVPGARLTRPFFGGDAVVFRTDGGRAVVTHAFCPHLGAHLGRGGHVEGETLRCSFHGFRFDAEGRCVPAYPDARPPPACRLPVFPPREHGGQIIAFYHPDGAAPTWEVPVLEHHDYRPPPDDREDNVRTSRERGVQQVVIAFSTVSSGWPCACGEPQHCRRSSSGFRVLMVEAGVGRVADGRGRTRIVAMPVRACVSMPVARHDDQGAARCGPSSRTLSLRICDASTGHA